MKLFFFPRDKLFWQYHCSGLFLRMLVQGLIVYFFQDEKLLSAAAGSVWVPLFTFGLLFFRYFYKKYEWKNFSTLKQIVYVFIYGLIMGAVITVVMFGIVAPFFWAHILSNPAILEHKITLAQFMLQVFVGNTIYTQLDLCAWIFIYITIGSGRRIREGEVNNLRLQNSLKEAQLANLSNQINPHFLFNALNNIRFTIHKNPAKADDMLTGLSEMLRYSLESSRQDKVRLSEELEIVDRYISLIKVQMSDRLRFSVNIPTSLNACLIPPMILQLLIENAVKHGVDKLRHGGGIELSAEVIGGKIQFIVRNARGDNKSLLDDMQRKNTGIGLVNIKSRLQLLYGERASVLIDDAIDFFSVTLILPKESA